MPELHAFLSASDSMRWGGDGADIQGCAAALRHTKDIVDRGSEAANWGTAAHEVGAWCLSNNTQAEGYPHKAVMVDGRDWPVTREMKECVDQYLEFVRDRIEDGVLMPEQKVSYGRYLFGPITDLQLRDHKTGQFVFVKAEDLAFGTADAPILNRHGRIIDLKTGANPNNKVSADHPQLKLYALGVLHEFGMVEEIETVTASICQPRIDHFPEATFTVAELEAFAKEMGVRAHRALQVYNADSEPELSDYAPSDETCKWCSGKATCPALAADVEQETEDLFAALVPAEIPEDRLARAMAKVPLIEELTKSIRAEVERRLLAGQPVVGFKLVEGRRGARKWLDETVAAKTLRRLLGAKDALKEPEPISPTEAEKFVKKGLLSDRQWSTLNKNIGQSDGKPSVAPDSDDRKAISVASVDAEFALLTDQSVEELV